MSRTTLRLAKQNFKFSAAHFLIFDESRAERLHGHNYQVKVNLYFKDSQKYENEFGYLVDFNLLKKTIKARLDLWDEMVLLPHQQKEMNFVQEGNEIEVRFRNRRYVFPLNEVVLLPVTNTSVEQMSRLLAQDFLLAFKKFQVEAVQVNVEETQGQSCSTLLRA